MTLLFFRDFFMSYVEILKYNSASFITYSVIWVAREVIFSYWYTNIYEADVSFNLIFTRFRLPCSQGMHLFFTDSLYNARGFERGFRVSRSSCMFAENMEAEVVPVLVRGDDRGHSFTRKMFLPWFRTGIHPHIIGGVTIRHNLRKQCTLIRSDFFILFFNRKNKQKTKRKGKKCVIYTEVVWEKSSENNRSFSRDISFPKIQN